jgi:hypothetical protein
MGRCAVGIASGHARVSATPNPVSALRHSNGTARVRRSEGTVHPTLAPTDRPGLSIAKIQKSRCPLSSNPPNPEITRGVVREKRHPDFWIRGMTGETTPGFLDFRISGISFFR